MVQKKRRRKLKKSGIVIIVSVLVGIVAIGILIHSVQSQNKAYQQTYDSLVLQINQEKLKIEYGSEIVLDDIVKDSSDDYVIQGNIDTTTVGIQELIFQMEKDDQYGHPVIREYHVPCKVVDTHAPIVSLNSQTVKLSLSQEYNPYTNILSVEDVIDGALQQDDTYRNGTYHIEGEYDLNTPGIYELRVYAKDKNGVETYQSFQLHVE